MALGPGPHTVGAQNGTLQVRTYREGMAQKVGHDLIIEVREWQATVQTSADGSPGSIEIEADPQSLQVVEGLGGVKPLSEKDRGEIRKAIMEKVLGKEKITFRSSEIESSAEGHVARGELSIAGTSRPVSLDLTLTAGGHVTATVPITQSEWGIKPYRALMGALKVRDSVEVVVDVQLPVD